MRKLGLLVAMSALLDASHPRIAFGGAECGSAIGRQLRPDVVASVRLTLDLIQPRLFCGELLREHD